MPALPVLVACFLALIAVGLLYRRPIRWVGLLMISALSAWIAVIRGAGAVLTQDGSAAGKTSAMGWAVAGSAFGLLTVVLFTLSFRSARTTRRHGQIDE